MLLPDDKTPEVNIHIMRDVVNQEGKLLKRHTDENMETQLKARLWFLITNTPTAKVTVISISKPERKTAKRYTDLGKIFDSSIPTELDRMKVYENNSHKSKLERKGTNKTRLSLQNRINSTL